ncbi:MAG: hypothetical protein JWP97_2359 [Labilithrix sp.]|nr:hypothetical protein [Labilithrix sp.]
MAARQARTRIAALVVTLASRVVSRGSAAALVVGASALACASPTLPLPPPAAPTIASGVAPDTFQLTSIEGAEPNALVIIVNRREDLAPYDRVSGTIADAHGTWTAFVKAAPGDVLDISQQSGSTQSPSTTVTVPRR